MQWHGGHFIFPSSSLSGILKRRDDVTYIAYVYIEAKSFYISNAMNMHITKKLNFILQNDMFTNHSITKHIYTNATQNIGIESARNS